MNQASLSYHFDRIGARAKVRPWGFRDRARGLSIDIRNDRSGEYFDVAVPLDQKIELQVLDVKPSLRHLLLMSNQNDGKHKFLCGHDERHWFVAAVPEKASVGSVQTAFDALKPAAVRSLEARMQVKPAKRNRRRNEAFVRQGEWFFVPVEEDSFIDARLALYNEPISRGRGSKPHFCEELVRQGGQVVYVCHRFPAGLTENEYRNYLREHPDARNIHWAAQRRNPNVFVRGRVRHTDHKTIYLDGWHQVHMNTENESISMRNVAFLD